MTSNKCANCGAITIPGAEHRHWDCVQKLRLQRERLKTENEELITTLEAIIALPEVDREAFQKARAIAKTALSWD